jgi:hypothetical protein
LHFSAGCGNLGRSNYAAPVNNINELFFTVLVCLLAVPVLLLVLHLAWRKIRPRRHRRHHRHRLHRHGRGLRE